MSKHIPDINLSMATVIAKLDMLQETLAHETSKADGGNVLWMAWARTRIKSLTELLPGKEAAR